MEREHVPEPKKLNPSGSLPEYLGCKVRTAREARHWSQDELGSKVFVSRTRVAKIELGTDPPNLTLAGQLDQVLELGEDLRNLVRLINNQAVRDYAQPYLAKEPLATVLHRYSLVVPGLLQIPDYARAMIRAGQPGGSGDGEAYVERRVERQQIWEREDPPWMCPGVVPVRDSKDPNGPALVFSASSWSAFVRAAKADDFQ